MQVEADPEKAIQELGRKYEENDKETTNLIRTMVERCLEGIKTSLHDIEIDFDKWEWESQLLWDGLVKKTLGKLTQLDLSQNQRVLHWFWIRCDCGGL